MKRIILLSLFLAVAQSATAVCQKCVRIRAENEEKAKDQTWVFYEDWLDTDEGKGQSGITFDEETTENTLNRQDLKNK